ncbi:chromate transporter-domain-containing protein [Apodospora peruviana]|uniref:Chromate transporter-domain-containing protein n=1 Tax=Apodospora peruviana TaxID=516989 RepID=A0AAE0IS15_9PEZI|nr:chromate transporter-domain-containing protein [Apodospora peruviana]
MDILKKHWGRPPAADWMRSLKRSNFYGRFFGNDDSNDDQSNGGNGNGNSRGSGLSSTVRENWYLGFTAFGGPPVHFKIFHDKFVTKLGWIDEQVYQELFSVCQSFSGPGSTKMHYCINLIHNGFLSAVLGFLMWSLPGALGMFGLAIGVSNIGTSLPRAVYALLSGLNAATVGIIALAAVQLAQKAITDKMTRSLVFLGAAAGLLYNALWYFPLLMLVAGGMAVVHDFCWLHGPVKRVAGGVWSVKQTFMLLFGRGEKRRRREERTRREADDMEMSQRETDNKNDNNNDNNHASSSSNHKTGTRMTQDTDGGVPPSTAETEPRIVPPSHDLNSKVIFWRFGLLLILLFLVSFTVIMLLRGLLPTKPLLYRLFSNMYLAGTIIFGGGPVVIPLLREYVVAENWVSPRDFLIGLALIQGFPGPNFNFAVYLGALTAINGGYSAALGALLGYIGIFVPGLVTMHGTMGVWGAIRGMRWVRSGLRGVNAAAVGLIYTAVYRLWQIGWIDEGFQQGTSLANDPWWVVVTATSYVGGCWYGVSPPVACLLGAVLGLVRYGVVQGQGL